jgi:hypothetical protein
VVVAVAPSIYLWRENRRLERELQAASGAAAATTDERAPVAAAAPATPAAEPEERGERSRLLGALGRAVNGLRGKRPDAEPAPEGEKRDDDQDSRRDRRQRWLKNLLGRHEGETEDEYRARVKPLVEGGLAGPRDRVEEKRRQFEEAAGVTDEQRAQLDQAFAEAGNELLAVANQAIQSGDLTPYRRNSYGVFSAFSGAVPTIEALDQRLRGILTQEQWQTMDEAGFDWLEYLGLTTGWEGLNPPPPEGSPGG